MRLKLGRGCPDWTASLFMFDSYTLLLGKGVGDCGDLI